MKGKHAQITVVSRKSGNVKLVKIDTQSATAVSSRTNDSCHSVFFIPFVTFYGNKIFQQKSFIKFFVSTYTQ